MTDIDSSAKKMKKKVQSNKVEIESGLNRKNASKVDSLVVKELKNLYKSHLLPIERNHSFNKFNHPEILDSELSAKPTVLLVGQYSTGKTSFIRQLIGMDYPDIHIGPEPTTDKFIAVVYGEETKTIMGNALTGVDDLPFSGLSTFGSSFLTKFSAAVVPAPILKTMNIIDTPGVLSGEKQRTSRGYEFDKVCRWFAERSDLILLMFDCSKLDISDEFKRVIEELQPHEDKVHCVLNKADQLDTESLMRVYGALLWSMGRIFKGAEVSRVYVGSFREEAITREEHAVLFARDKDVLMGHLSQLPNACSMRKINEMVKRIRLLIVHVCIAGQLRSSLPYLWGKEKAQVAMIEKLQDVFNAVRRKYQLAEGDFPKIDEFRTQLGLLDFSKFAHTDRKVLNTLQDLLANEIPKITAHVAGIAEVYVDSSDDNINTNSNTNSESASSKQPQLFTLPDSHRDHESNRKSAVIYSSVSLVVIAVLVLLASFLFEKEFAAILVKIQNHSLVKDILSKFKSFKA